MAQVITEACIDVKDGKCAVCCPVGCICEGCLTGIDHPEIRSYTRQ
jgi:hypothetical protein